MIDTATFFFWNLHIILESLPISSSSHLFLIHQFLFGTKSMPEETTQELMHIPTIMVISTAMAYFIWQPTVITRLSFVTLISLLMAIAIADLITGIFYVILKKYRSIRNRFPLLLGLSISALSLLSLFWCSFGDLHYVSPLHALIIGIAQASALLPGISRLAITLVTTAWLGINPLAGALFSLAIELPLIIAAVAKAFINAPQSARLLYALSIPQLLVLMASTTLSSALLVGVILMHMHHHLYIFGCYLLALSFLLTLFRYWSQLRSHHR